LGTLAPIASLLSAGFSSIKTGFFIPRKVAFYGILPESLMTSLKFSIRSGTQSSLAAEQSVRTLSYSKS
ncbi:MAG: hypothetical protein QXV48_03800, partial [Desulfurococcaceae archaeon]